MYNKRQELILDFIADNPSSKREDIEHFLIKMGEKAKELSNKDALEIIYKQIKETILHKC